MGDVLTKNLTCLDRLIPLGVVFLHGVPKFHLESVAPDGWRWFNLPYDYNLQYYDPVSRGAKTLSSLLVDVRYLMERCHVRVTARHFAAEALAVLRVYVVPVDCEGSSVVQQHRARYRRGKGMSWHEARYRKAMRLLLCVLDYSPVAWDVASAEDVFSRKCDVMLFPCLVDWQPFSGAQIGQSGAAMSKELFNYHLDRLRGRKASSAVSSSAVTNESPEETLLRIYDSIDIQEHKPVAQNELQELCVAVFDDEIPAIRSTLYRYQKESVQEMLVKEHAQGRSLMPNLVEFRSSGTVWYLDIETMAFMQSPECFGPVRGGILAENMGLGKTCICLALICLTKHQMSQIPSKFYPHAPAHLVANKTKSLALHCVETVNRNSVPWKKYIDYLPEECIKLLSNTPGYFEIPHVLLNTRRQSARLAVETPLTKLYLSSTTLVVVPNNLYYQWISEIKKHCLDNALKVLYVPFHAANANYMFPGAESIIQFDMVLMATSSFVSQLNSESPLHRVFWKRLVIDEGHSMSSRITRLVQLASELHVERRWLVSGTPTSGLTKLYVSNHEEVDNSSINNHSIKRKFSAKDDLTRLGLIVHNFFKIEPWANNLSLFSKTIVKPFFSNSYGAVQSLQNLLLHLIIRHSIQTVETDIILPPLSHKAVFLEPSYHNKMSINLFVSVLAANAVTSERTDQDYMFHPSNRASLKRLITNLQRSTFHWVGFSIDDITTLIKICHSALDKKINNSYYHSFKDRLLLHKCIESANMALNNKLWKTNSSLHEMSYFVSGLPQPYCQNYSVNGMVSVYPYMMLNSIQNFFFKNRFLNDYDKLAEKLKPYATLFWKTYWKDYHKKYKKTGKFNNIETFTKNTTANTNNHDIHHNTTNKHNIQHNITQNTADAPVEATRKAHLLGTVSAKLSYLGARLLDHHVNGIKSIIFYQFEDLAYYLVELLDLLGLDYILYSTSIPIHQRNSKLIEFDQHSKPTGVTLIMDLKLASHGLTIISATRMYFLSPVWKKAVEAQAIKRCHRIGQTKAVHVETLILQNTLEEEMYRLRDKARTEETDPSGDVYDDQGMKQYFENHEFLKLDNHEEYIGFKAPALDHHPILIDSLENPTDDIQKYIEELENDLFKLMKPIGRLESGTRHWNIPVFTEAALNKINESQLKVKRFINEEEVINQSFDDQNKTQDGLKRRETLAKLKDMRKPRKKLRFN